MFTDPFFKLIRCQRIIRPFYKENPVNEVIMNVLQIKEKKNFPLFPRHFTCIQSNILFKSFYFGYIEEILNIFCFLSISLREKCSNTEFFLVSIFPHSDWIRTRKNSVFGHFSRSVSYLYLRFLFSVKQTHVSN